MARHDVPDGRRRPRVTAILIFAVAGALAAAVSGLVSRTLGGTATGKIAATAAPLLIMGIATFMILDHLNIAPAIVQITYIDLLGSVALGMASRSGSVVPTSGPSCSTTRVGGAATNASSRVPGGSTRHASDAAAAAAGRVSAAGALLRLALR
jgi:hypothetical protein